MDIKNLPRARTTIDIVWAYFWCDLARFSLEVVLRRGGGHNGSGEAEEKPFRSTHRDSHHMSCTCCVTTCWVNCIYSRPSSTDMAPSFQFPSPVLSVAADAVRDLQGSDALKSLWTRTYI
jgi:hypothetical protein